MAVGKGSIKRAAKAVDSAAKTTPVRKAPAKKAPAKKEEVKEVKTIGIGTELPTYLL